MRVVFPMASGGSKRALEAFITATRGRDWKRSAPVLEGDRAYYDLLAGLWDDGESFCVVEHDVAVHETALDELAACPHDWCSFPFQYGNTVTHGLACVKFSAELIARNPDAMIKVGVMHDPTHRKKHWCRLDAWLQGVILPNAGETLHKHETLVRHLDTGCSHGCTPNL